MVHTDYVKTSDWFAWKPVKTEDSGWVWLKTVSRTVDDRPLVYMGLLTQYSYKLLPYEVVE